MNFGKGLYGAFIEEGLDDWQVLQQEKGSAFVHIKGSFIVPPLPEGREIIAYMPVIRIVAEDDNRIISPWKRAGFVCDQQEGAGRWEVNLKMPAGGLYRIESGLECRENINPDLKVIYRGDSRFHIGVGNVFAIAGQSNASGFAHDMAYDPPDIRVHVFRNRNKWELAAHPLNDATEAYDNLSNEIGRCGSSPFLHFARRYADRTGLPVGLIPTAMGGQPIIRWDERVDGALFENMLKRMEASGTLPIAIIWYQGCTDAVNGEAEEYFERFQYIVARIRKEMGYEIPVFTFQLNRILSGDGGDKWGMIREAQRLSALKSSKVYILPTLDCKLSDVIHNSASANLVLGERLAMQCFYHLDKGAFYEAPNIRNAKLISPRRMILEFENVIGNLVFQADDAETCGFYAEDELGTVALLKMHGQEDGKSFTIEMERKTKGKVYISFLHEANPKKIPVIDDESFLPPLSFYKFLVNQ